MGSFLLGDFPRNSGNSSWQFCAESSSVLVLLVVFIFSLCFQILCLFCHLFAAVADTNSVFKLQLCLLQHMCTGFVISTAYKHLNVW